MGSKRKPRIALEAFENALIVLESGSFRRAASALAVQPSAVSRRIRLLEDELGVSLFQRRTQGVEPTPAGRRVLARARAVLDDVNALVRTARLSGSSTEGRLCIGVVSSIAGGMLRHLLAAYVTARPRVDITIVEGSPRDHIPAVASLKMDATFVVGAPTAPGCELEPLWRERVMACLSSSHPLATARRDLKWAELAGERFIVTKVDPGPEIQDFVVKNLARLGQHPRIEDRAVHRETLLAMVGLGLGISLVGEAEAAVAYPGVAFVPLEGALLPFHAVWSTRNDNPALRSFLSQSRTEVQRVAAAMANADVERIPDPSL